MPASIVTLTMNPAVDVVASVPELGPFRKLRCGPERRDAGGGGINVARVAKRLGADPLAVFAAGGSIGQLLVKLVGAERVDCHVVPIAAETREDFTLLDEKTQFPYRFVFPGPHLSAAEGQACVAAFEDKLAPGTFAVASGSLPPGMQDALYADAAKAAKRARAKFVLDSSGAALKAALDEGVYLVKPNRRELSSVAGTMLETEEQWLSASRALTAKGRAQIVALTLADKGALLVSRDRVLRANAPQVTPVSTVGAGDSFLGALVAALAKDVPLTDAFRTAVASGTAALLAEGTELARAQDIETIAARVEVKAL